MDKRFNKRQFWLGAYDSDSDDGEDDCGDMVLCVADDDSDRAVDVEEGHAEDTHGIRSNKSLSSMSKQQRCGSRRPSVRSGTRRPSVRSVAGTSRQFTVITYEGNDENNEDNDSDSDSVVLPAITSPYASVNNANVPENTTSPRRSSVPTIRINGESGGKPHASPPIIPHNRSHHSIGHFAKHRSSIHQRSMSMFDENQLNIRKPLLEGQNNNHALGANFQTGLDAQNNNHVLGGSFHNGLHAPNRNLSQDEIDAYEAEEGVFKSWDWRKDFIGVARWGRLFGKRKQNRLVTKSGDYNIVHLNQSKKSLQYMMDIFTTLLDLSWGYTLMLIILTFLGGWLGFALLYWAMVAASASVGSGTSISAVVLEEGGLQYPRNSSHATDAADTTSNADSSEAPIECVTGVHSFVTALLFSIETQQTIGYGTRAVTDQCCGAILLVMLQSVFGVVIQCVLTGLVFAKLASGKRRGETLMFSKNAVICRHRGHLCFMFQLADMRKAHMICVSVSVIMIKHKVRLGKGRDITQSMMQYKLEVYTEVDDLFFLALPVRVVHRIDEHSPMYDLSAEQLMSEDFEIVVVLEGVNESSGMSVQVRTSYLPGEIMWGHKHGPLVTNQRKNGTYNIDYARFNEVLPVDTPEMSAREMKGQGKLSSSRRASTMSAAPNVNSTAAAAAAAAVASRAVFSHQISTVDEKDEDDTMSAAPNIVNSMAAAAPRAVFSRQISTVDEKDEDDTTTP